MRASEKSASPRGPSAGIALALEERHADGPDRGGAGSGHRPRRRRRRESLFYQAVRAGPPALARRERGAARRRMATRVNAAPGDDLTVAYRRLNAAYQQTLRYAEDVRRLYQQ